jgi:hypothetical protein
MSGFVLRMTILLTIAGWCLFSRYFAFYVMFCRSLFVLFLLVILLYVLLRLTVSNYPFGIFKLHIFKCLPLFLICCCLYPVPPLPLLSLEPCQW